MRTEPASLGLAAVPPGAEAAAGPDMGLALRVVLRRLPVILLLAAIGGALGFAAQRALTPRYTSTVSLLLEPKRSDSFGADTTFGSMYVDEAKIASVVSVITSSDLLARVVQQERLDLVPEFGAPAPSLLRRVLAHLPFFARPAPDPGGASRMARAELELSRAVSVERVGFTYVVTISAKADDPALAQRIAAAMAGAYLADQVDRKVAATQRDAAWLTERLDAVRRDLEQSEAAVDAVRRRYGLLETALGSGATLDRQSLTDLNAQLVRAEANEAELRARDEQVGAGSLDQLGDVVASPLIQSLRAKQAEDSKELAALSASLGPDHPSVRRLRESAQTLQTQIDRETARIAGSRRSDYAAAAARTRALRDEVDRAMAANGSAANDEGHQRLREAERHADENRGLYQTLLTKWRELRQQQTREEPEARVISAADLPDQPSFPKPLLFPAGGAALFLMLGLAGTALPAAFGRRFATVASVEQRLGMPVLGAIPVLGRGDRHGGSDAAPAWAGRQRLSQFAESLRIVRALLNVSPDGPARILQVTSAASGEGKSTLAAALAASAASAGIPTVLIDADLRRGGLSALLGLGRVAGLADLLAGGAPGAAADLLQRRSDIPLAVLGSGALLPARPELIENGRLAAVLDELAGEARLIVLDTPPALPVSDALLIARRVHATVLVVHWRATIRRVAEQAVRRLRAVGAPLAGVLLNRVDLAMMSHDEGVSAAAYAYGPARRGLALPWQSQARL